MGHTSGTVSIRFLIGLERAADKALPDSQRATLAENAHARALAVLGGAYGFGGAYRGVGYWRGDPEPCMTFEVIQRYGSPQGRADAEAFACSNARTLARELGQEAVGLVVQEVAYSEVPA